MRIREGDPLEIFTDNDGEVIFKKYSPIGELSSLAGQYAEVLYRAVGHPVVVCDRDHVVTAAGIPKKEILERRVSHALEEMMEQRKTYPTSGVEGKPLMPVEGVDRPALAQAPILAAGDVCGSVLFLCTDPGDRATDADLKLITVAAAFLGRQMEQ